MSKIRIRKPNFFIVGSRKCGTTALYNYLKLHPDIFLPELKEPKYFGKDLPFKKTRWDNSPKKYLQLFKNADNRKMIGEASTSYLYSKSAAYEIKKFSPDAKIIIMLRNPVDQIYASHAGMYYLGIENIANFKKALASEKKRELLSKKNKNLRILLYRHNALYYQQVKRFIDLFEYKNVHFVKFDEFVKNTEKVYKSTLKFLQVDETYKIDLEKVNSNRVKNSSNKPRVWKIQNILFNPPQYFKAAAKNNEIISKIGYCIYIN